MRIVLRPGHGLTPPGPLAYSRYTRRNKQSADSVFGWSLQRPGNKEDDYTAKFCGSYLIPALVDAGHCVQCQRAIAPVSGALDETLVTIGPDVFPQLHASQAETVERWRLNAAVEAVLRGAARPDWGRGDGWSHDPVIATWWERQAPGDLFLSIHQNWYSNPSYHGPVVMHCESSSRGARLARSVYDEILAAHDGDPWIEGIEDWGGPGREAYQTRGGRGQILPSRLWELRKTRAPAVLVELAFASNVDDRARMADPAWCARMAEAIVRGLPQ